jgi:hypothetical protein
MQPKRGPIRNQRHGINGRSVTVFLPADVDREVRKLAARQGVSVSLVVTRAVQMLLTDSPVSDEQGRVTA